MLTGLPCASLQHNSRMPHIDAQCVKGNQTPRTHTEKVTDLAIHDCFSIGNNELKMNLPAATKSSLDV
jgi:hypothetical protein